MAKAVKNINRVEVITHVDKITGYTLELTEDEAKALRTILANIGGDEFSTRRKYVRSVSKALDEAGLTFFTISESDLHGYLYFS